MGKWGPYFLVTTRGQYIVNLLSWLPINTISKDEDRPITLQIVWLNATPLPEFVFMNKVLENRDFFYLYKCLFRDLHVRFPFNDFTIGVLLVLNMAPSQLHLNGWAAIQEFQALCLYTSFEATPGLFLH